MGEGAASHPAGPPCRLTTCNEHPRCSWHCPSAGRRSVLTPRPSSPCLRAPAHQRTPPTRSAPPGVPVVQPRPHVQTFVVHLHGHLGREVAAVQELPACAAEQAPDACERHGSGAWAARARKARSRQPQAGGTHDGDVKGRCSAPDTTSYSKPSMSICTAARPEKAGIQCERDCAAETRP